MGTAASIIGNSLPSYELYKKNFEVLKLIKNMRAEHEIEGFKGWLLDIGDKKEYSKILGPDYVKIPQ